MANGNKRILSIDALRGLAVVGMVLCASIGFNSGLPAWMFHAQTPPPTYAFNPDLPGLTWVDLVFPFFLFPLGAAFPLAMRKKLERGTGRWKVFLGLVKRWVILTCFALVLGNSYDIAASMRPAWSVNLFRIAVWGALFLSLVRIGEASPEESGKGIGGWLRRNRGKVVNFAGLSALVGLGFIKTGWFGVGIDKYNSDIIMMILANVALAGGTIWMLTMNRQGLRWLIFGFIAMVKALSSYCPQVLEFIPECSACGWFFKWEYLQYLLIAIPGSVVGDVLLENFRRGKEGTFDRRSAWAGFIALAAMVFQLWGLYTRNVAADLVVSIILAACFAALTWKRKDNLTITGNLGFIFLIAGIVFDPVDGGITKDYCNLSYLFTTCGMAALTNSFFIMLEGNFKKGCRILVMTGQNPIIAYTVTSFLIIPVMSLCGIMDGLSALTVGSVFWGMAQGIILTALMTAVTCLFTKAQVFWRS